jgi:hypothetical protein
MNKRKLNVPDGVRYLGQWEDFGAQLPNDCHFILNKALHEGQMLFLTYYSPTDIIF